MFLSNPVKKMLIEKILAPDGWLEFNSFYTLVNGMNLLGLVYQPSDESTRLTKLTNGKTKHHIFTKNTLEKYEDIEKLKKTNISKFEFIGNIGKKSVKLTFIHDYTNTSIKTNNKPENHYFLSMKSFGYIKNNQPLFSFSNYVDTFHLHTEHPQPTLLYYQKNGHLWKTEFFSHDEYVKENKPRTIIYDEKDYGKSQLKFYEPIDKKSYVEFIKLSENKVIDARININNRSIKLKTFNNMFLDFSSFSEDQLLNINEYLTTEHYAISDMIHI